MRAILFIFLLIFVSCGDEMSKPAREFKFDTTKANIEPIGNAREVSGYGEREVVSHKNLNDMMANISDWTMYLSKMIGKSCHIAITGDDDNDGTEANPYRSFAKAFSSVEPGASLDIIIDESGTYEIDEDIDAYNIKFSIYENTGVFAVLKHKTYLNDNKNDFYKIKLHNSSEARIRVTQFILEDVNAAKATDAGACAIYSYSGFNKIDIYGKNSGTGIALPSNKGTSGLPSIVKSFGVAAMSPFTSVSVSGDVKTYENGYIFDTQETPSALFESNSTIDFPEYWVENGLSQNQVIYTGYFSDSLGNSITMYVNGSSLTGHVTATLNDTDSDATIKAAIKAVLNGLFETEIIAFNLSTTRTGSNEVKSIIIENKGAFTGQALPFSLYFAGTDHKGYFYELQKAQKNMNLLTNISLLK